jgi:hypothetical protein
MQPHGKMKGAHDNFAGNVDGMAIWHICLLQQLRIASL